MIAMTTNNSISVNPNALVGLGICASFVFIIRIPPRDYRIFFAVYQFFGKREFQTTSGQPRVVNKVKADLN
jgi:hypothetical protein